MNGGGILTPIGQGREDFVNVIHRQDDRGKVRGAAREKQSRVFEYLAKVLSKQN
jgi:hypothetical protein